MFIKKTLLSIIFFIICCIATLTPSYSDYTFNSSEEFEAYIEEMEANSNKNENSLPPVYDDTAELAFKRLAPATGFFVSLCLAIFPLSFIAIVILCFTCRNEKNFAMYIKILGVVCITTLIVLLIEGNTINNLVEQILGSIGL